MLLNYSCLNSVQTLQRPPRKIHRAKKKKKKALDPGAKSSQKLIGFGSYTFPCPHKYG